MFRVISCATLAVLLLDLGSLAYASSLFSIVTGPKTGTYYAFGRDIAQVAGKAGIDLQVKSSQGSIDNIKRLNSTENAALGIVQSDVMGFLTRSKNADSIRMANNLRVVYPLYNEEVHVLARRGITSFAGLAGKKVAIGEEGSGSMLTAVNLFSVMGVTPAEIKKIPAAQGLVSVLGGDLDAVIFVGGKPVRLFKNLEDLAQPENQKYAAMLDHVHFLPLNDPKMYGDYTPAMLTTEDYAFVEENVPTIAVQALLVSYDFSRSKGQKRCDTLETLAKAIRTALPTLQQNAHPKWKEVNLDNYPGTWKKDACAWR